VSEQEQPSTDRGSGKARWLAGQEELARAAEARPRWRRGLLPGSTLPSTHAPGWEQRHWTSRVLHHVGQIVAHSGAGIVAAALVLGWAVAGIVTGFPEWWATVLYSSTASVTFIMVFVIQHTHGRQIAATQRKLDELIRTTVSADNTLIAVEEAADEQLEVLTHLNVADRTTATTELEDADSDTDATMTNDAIPTT
jgi:low affinity Fe/Cu permease